jgi:hypothetical protein
MHSFWNGFEKKASRFSRAAGLISGGAGAAATYKLTRKGLSNPNAAGVPKFLGDMVRKSNNPSVRALAPYGMSAIGGGIAEELGRRGALALEKRFRSRSSRVQDFLKGFKNSYKKFLKKIEKSRKSK